MNPQQIHEWRAQSVDWMAARPHEVDASSTRLIAPPRPPPRPPRNRDGNGVLTSTANTTTTINTTTTSNNNNNLISSNHSPHPDLCTPSMSGGGDHYDDPNPISGMAPPSSTSSSGLSSGQDSSRDSEVHRFLLPQRGGPTTAHGDPPTSFASSPQHRSQLATAGAGVNNAGAEAFHQDHQKLEKSNRRLGIVFKVLVTLCSLALVIYLGLIVALFVLLSGGSRSLENGPGQTSRHSWQGGGRRGQGGSREVVQEDCVPDEDMKEFKNIWDPEDHKSISDMLEDVGFVRYSEPRRREYCFRSLQWVPHIMGKINSRVEDSLSYIEDQQEKINHTVNSYISASKTDSPCADQKQVHPGINDPTDPTLSVYAHFFLETKEKYQQSESGVQYLRWVQERQKQSSKNNVNVSSQKGEFTIKHSGFYFIYTNLVFNTDSSLKAHRVERWRNGQRTKLLQGVRSGVSSLQGVFQLWGGDILRVEATAHKLDTSRDKMSYFGLYLIRT